MGSLVSKFLASFYEWKVRSRVSSEVLPLKEFLNTCSLANIKKLQPSNIKICCGNQSADMDSVVSAIIYTYYNYLESSKVVLPVINIPLEDLKLRKDIVYALGQIGIINGLDVGNSPLIFIDDIKKLKKAYNCTVDAILVDHNEPQGMAKGIIDRVIGVVDHHEDTKSYDSELITSFGNPLIIETCGSCSSLITNYWLKKINPANVSFDAAKLGLAAAVLDTSNFKSKVEKQDLEALEHYTEILSASFDKKDYFKTLKAEKNNLDGLNMFDLLRKDFKLFEFSGLNIGMSSLGESMESFIAKFGIESINEACHKYYQSNNMDLLLLLTSYSDENKDHRRQMIFYCGEKAAVEEQVVAGVKDELELTKLNDFEKLTFYQQNKATASRKQIAPLVEKALRNHEQQ